MLHDLNSRIQNEFVLSDTSRPPFEPIMLYFRGMERIGSDTKIKGGATNFQIQYDISRLSAGIKCATQGCKYILFLTDAYLLIISACVSESITETSENRLRKYENIENHFICLKLLMN